MFGDYVCVFEEEYVFEVNELLGELVFDVVIVVYQDYLQCDEVGVVYEGYFVIDKKIKCFVDFKVLGWGDDKGQLIDVDVYDLILKDKECLFLFDEFVWFIFFYLVFCEGWDNFNVFVMGMFKKSDNIVFCCQEIGCGLCIVVD